MNKVLKGLLATYVLLVALFLCAMLAVHTIPHAWIERHAVESGRQLQDCGKYPRLWGNPLLRIDTFTDALMLNMAWCADESRPLDAALQNRYYTDDDMNVFERTQDVLNGRMSADGYYYSYARYWHGYQTLLRPMLVLTDYQGILWANAVCLLLLLALCLWAVGRYLSWRVAGLFLFSLALVALPVVLVCIQFSTCFFIALLAVFVILCCPGLTRNAVAACCTFFVIGALTAYLDLLTTPTLTLGLPLTVCLLSRPVWQSSKWVLRLTSVWLGGYALLWVSKCVVAQLLTDYDIVGSFLHAVQVRSVTGASTLWAPVQSVLGNVPFYLLGSLLFIAAVLCLALIAGLWRWGRRNEAARMNAWLVLIALQTPCWYLLTLQHSSVHYWFTWRALASTFFALFVFIYRVTSISHEQNRSTHTVL